VIFNFFKKNIFLIIFLFIFFITATIFIYNSKTSYSAKNNCCYHECNMGTSKCVYNVAFGCCTNCDGDPYQDWCSPDCVNPNGQDCTLTGQTCVDGVCTGSCAPGLTCNDYPDKCGNNLSNGCANTLDCSSNCSLPKICSSGNCICPDLDGDGHTDQLCGGDDCQDTGANANQRYPGNTEICDGIDNDCNNSTIDGSEELVPLNDNQNGVCIGFHKICSGTAGWTNNYSNIPHNQYPTETLCDELDNNCNGITDEGCNCQNGDTQICGSNIGECRTGVQTCDSGHWSECIGAIEATTEVCNNNSDDDCDNRIDCGDDDCSNSSFCITAPVVSSFNVSPRETSINNDIIINWVVIGTDLNRLEIWRTDDLYANWTNISTEAISGASASGSFTDSISSPGTYWYGVHVIDEVY